MENNNIESIFINLWKNLLNVPSPKCLSELWKQHSIIYEQMSIVKKIQETFKRPGIYIWLIK